MLSEYIGSIITLVLACVGLIVWLIRLEGRVTTETALREALADRLNSFESRIYSALDRIEARLDTRPTRDEIDR